jgi:hypothetical protein
MSEDMFAWLSHVPDERIVPCGAAAPASMDLPGRRACVSHDKEADEE